MIISLLFTGHYRREGIVLDNRGFTLIELMMMSLTQILSVLLCHQGAE